MSLDYLVGEGVNSMFDKETLKRLYDLEALEEEKKNTLYDLMDPYLRNAKARKAYARKRLQQPLRLSTKHKLN